MSISASISAARVMPPWTQAMQAGAESADGGGLGRREQAGIDAADHQQEDDDDRPDRQHRSQPLGQAAPHAAARVRVEAHVDADRGA